MLTRQQIREQRANDIYREAARVLSTFGYERATIRDIAEATHMTKAGLYYYFDNKEDLLYIILNGYMDDLLAGITEIDQEQLAPKQRLSKFIGFHVDQYCRDIFRSKLIIQDGHCLSFEKHQIIKEKERRYMSFWKKAFSAYCAQEGLKAEHTSVNMMILVGICNWIYKWYDPEGDVTPEELSGLIFDRFFGPWCE